MASNVISNEKQTRVTAIPIVRCLAEAILIFDILFRACKKATPQIINLSLCFIILCDFSYFSNVYLLQLLNLTTMMICFTVQQKTSTS